MNTTKILIIDDEIEFADTLAERLILRNFEALAVPGAEDGMAALQGDFQPDVVVLDLKMPGLDGIETLSLIKGKNPAIEVILLTGHGSTTAAMEGMQRGLFDYLMKPVDISELVGKIEEAARKKQQSATGG